MGAKALQLKVAGVVSWNGPGVRDLAEGAGNRGYDPAFLRPHRKDVRSGRLVGLGKLLGKVEMWLSVAVRLHVTGEVRGAQMKVAIVERSRRVIGLVDQGCDCH